MRFSRLHSILLLIFLCFSWSVPAEISLVKDADLVPAEKYARATELITHIIDKYHYKNKKLDDDLSAAVLDRYLESLDPTKSYFMAEDVKRFQIYRDKLDDALQNAELAPAYEIFKVYRKRVDERIAYAVKLLDQDFTFDKDEDFIFDRKMLPWPATTAEINDQWRQRVANDILNLRLSGKQSTEYKDTLRKRYERMRTSTYQLDDNDVFQIFINAYTTTIEPHTAYFSPRTSENFDISMRLSLEGIGAVLSSDNDYTVIQHIIPGGPADLSKQLHDEDKIIGVGQGDKGEIIDVIGWRLDDVVDLIRGPKDTVLRMEILPKDSGIQGPGKTITLTRDKIKLEEQAARSSIIEIPDGNKRVGVITLPTFYIDFAAQARGDKDYTSTTRDVKKLIADLQKQNIEGLVIDLRGNGGGSLSEALELTGLFIKEGPVVQTRDASGKVEINNDPDPSISYTGPMAVLVDRNSASASEIFAGAIQDYQRAIIIGEPTFGKGTVQNVVDLNRFSRDSNADLGKLKTTIAQFFRITGSSNQFKGVIPDITFPTARDTAKYGERSLDNALPWSQVKPAKFIKVNQPLDNFYPLVRNKFEQRIKTEKAFNLLVQELELVGKATDRKSVSLLESRRKSEQDQLTQARRALTNEIRLAQGLPPLAENADPGVEEKDSDKDNKATDILLRESALILNDLVMFSGKQPAGVRSANQGNMDQLNASITEPVRH
jgi:carboxyl-terminal processing protease